MKKEEKIIIFTDLDGTLLNSATYSYQEVLPTIRKLQKKGIPIVFCTAKTRAENEYYQKKLKINDPFIVENGGAIFIPKNYFSFKFPFQKKKNNYRVIELGASYSEIRKRIKTVREKTKFNIAGFGDLGWEEVARLTNLSPQGAKLAKQREYDETFIIEKGAERKILKALKSQGLQIQFGGKFYDASSPKSNKGKAVKILSSLFRKKFGKIKTMGLGDSPNDFPMLKAVDLPVLVQKPSGIWSLNFKNLTRIKAVGPRGWKTAVKKFVLNNG